MLNTEIIRDTGSGRKRASEIDDGQQWLADLRQRMRKELLIAEVMVLSPSRAAALLSVNPDNRNISDAQVETFASDISNGRMQFNGEPIIIADTGELNDGQHRCKAVCLSGKAIEVLIVAGVPRASRTTVDMGRVRNVGDFLHMHGIASASNVASVASIVLAHETNRMAGIGATARKRTAPHHGFFKERPSKQEVLTFAREIMPDIQRAMKALDGNKCNLVGTYGRLAGFVCILGRHSKDWDAASAFVSSIVEGEGLKKGMPAFAARERLLAEKQARTLGTTRLFEVLARAWNAHRKGERISRMQLAGFIPALSR